MWLFTGRYAHFGPIICAIAIATLATGGIFLFCAARLIRRYDGFPVLLIAVTGVTFGYALVSSEPVFVGSGGLNRGMALFTGLIGFLLGCTGAIPIGRFRLIRLLLLIAAAGILIGDAAGWIHRSAGPSKYEHPIGLLRLSQLPGLVLAPAERGNGVSSTMPA